jgi:selenide,water dikinase
VALAFPVHGATDITGFGLLGHARELAVASKVSLALDHAAIEFFPGAIEYSRQGFIPGGLKRNMEFISGCVEFAGGIAEETQNLLFDPQTSGGLLFSVEASDGAGLVAALGARGVTAREVGEVISKTHPLIAVK